MPRKGYGITMAIKTNIRIASLDFSKANNYSRKDGKFEEESFKDLVLSMAVAGYKEDKPLKAMKAGAKARAMTFDDLSFPQLEWDFSPEGAKKGTTVVVVKADEVIGALSPTTPEYETVGGFRRSEAAAWAQILCTRIPNGVQFKNVVAVMCEPKDEAERVKLCLDENGDHDIGRQELTSLDLYHAGRHIWNGKESCLYSSHPPAEDGLVKRGVAQKLGYAIRLAITMTRVGRADIDEQFRSGKLDWRKFSWYETKKLLDAVKPVLDKAVSGAETSPEVQAAMDQVDEFLGSPKTTARAKGASAKNMMTKAEASACVIVKDSLDAAATNDLARLSCYNSSENAPLLNKAWELIKAGKVKLVGNLLIIDQDSNPTV